MIDGTFLKFLIVFVLIIGASMLVLHFFDGGTAASAALGQ